MKPRTSQRHAEHHRKLREYLADHHAPCPTCGYDLHETEPPWCPECGRSLSLRDVRPSYWGPWPWPWPLPKLPVLPMTRGQRVLALVSLLGLILTIVMWVRIGGLVEDIRGAGLFLMLLGFGVGLLGSQVRKGGLVYMGFSREPRVGFGLAIGWIGALIGVAGFRLVVT